MARRKRTVVDFKDFTYRSKYGTYDHCYLVVNRYVTKDKLRVDVMSPSEGPITTLTVNLVDVPMEINRCALNSIISYKEVEFLIQDGILKTLDGSVPSGYGNYYIATFSDEFMNYANSELADSELSTN